jgi:hypothetical protein
LLYDLSLEALNIAGLEYEWEVVGAVEVAAKPTAYNGVCIHSFSDQTSIFLIQLSVLMENIYWCEL